MKISFFVISHWVLWFGLVISLPSLAADKLTDERNTAALEIPNDFPPPLRAMVERAPAEARPALLAQLIARFQRDKKQIMMGIPFGLPTALRDRLEMMPPAERQEILDRMRREPGYLPPPPANFRARVEQMSPIERQAMRDALQDDELSTEQREARRRAMRERFENMTPQQRKQLMQDMSDSLNSVQRRETSVGSR